MLQMYKVFYKSNIIHFVSSDSSIQEGSSIHVLFYPDTRQIIASIHSCFTSISEIQTIFVITDDPKQSFQSFTNSLFLIEAAGGIITNETQEWLFIKRSGVWDLPKGKIDSGETREQAAIREVKEETGIKSVSIIKALSPSYHIYPIDNEWVFKVTYWFLMLGTKSKLKPQLIENITDAAWLNNQSIRKISRFIYPSLQEVIVEAGINVDQDYTENNTENKRV